MTAGAPAEQGLDAVRARLEQAFLALGSVDDPKLALVEADGGISTALREVYVALAARGARDLDEAYLAIGRAAEALRGVLGALQAAPSEAPAVHVVLASVGEALGLVLAPAARTAKARPFAAPPAPGPKAPLLPASLNEPVVLDVARPLLAPALPRAEPREPEPEVAPAPEPPPPASSLADLERMMAATEAEADAAGAESAAGAGPAGAPPKAEPPPLPSGSEADAEAERARFGVAKTEAEVLSGRARSLLEDLAMFGLLRRRSDEKPWESSERTERRLVRRLDALVACGTERFPALVKQLGERPLPDPELTWAHIMLFGSLSGDDALDQVRRLVVATPLDEGAMRRAVADALALAPRPEVSALVRSWLSDDVPFRRGVAVRAAARRGLFGPDDWSRAAADPEQVVVRAALAVLPRVTGPISNTEASAPFLRHQDERLARPALAGALLRRSRLAFDQARELLARGKPDFADAALLVALAGEGDVLRDLLARAEAAPTPGLLEALGWFGHLSAVPLLLQALEGGGPALAPAALGALQRLTGASLTEADPSPTYPDEERPFVRPRAEPPPPVALLLPDPAAWRAWWRQHGRTAEPHGRYRLGQQYLPEDDLREIEHPESRPALRRLCHIELVARTGGDLFIDRQDFVVRQQRQIAAWRGLLDRRRDRPGGYHAKLDR